MIKPTNACLKSLLCLSLSLQYVKVNAAFWCVEVSRCGLRGGQQRLSRKPNNPRWYCYRGNQRPLTSHAVASVVKRRSAAGTDSLCCSLFVLARQTMLVEAGDPNLVNVFFCFCFFAKGRRFAENKIFHAKDKKVQGQNCHSDSWKWSRRTVGFLFVGLEFSKSIAEWTNFISCFK